MKKELLLVTVLFAYTILCKAQLASDFEKGAATKLQITPGFIAEAEALVFRWPSSQPAPLRFSIGSYNTFQTTGDLVELRPKNFDKTGTINSVFTKRKIANYRARKGEKVATQRYQLDLTLLGYGNTITTKAEAFRFFSATYSNSEINGTIATRAKLLSDTSYLAAVIHLPDSSTWTLDLKYQQTIQTSSISGELYTGETKYLLQQQLTDRNGRKLEQPGLLFYSKKILVGAIDFPKIHGSTGIILFSPRLSLKDKQVFIAAGALYFGYRNTVKNNSPGELPDKVSK